MKQLIKYFWGDVEKDSSVVFIGTLINIIAGSLFFIVVPRILGPADYGLFATISASGILAVSIANLGIDTGILRFIKTKTEENFYFNLALKSYLILGLITAIAGLVLAPYLALFINQSEITNLLRVAFAATVFLLLTNFYTAALQAKKEYLKASLVGITSNIFRLLIIVVAAAAFTLNLTFAVLLFFIAPITSLLVGYLLLPIKLQKIDIKKSIPFYKYNIWIAISLIVTSIPFDNYLLLKYSGPEQAGIYAAPFKILTFTYQFSSGYSRVLATRLNNLKGDLISFYKQTSKIPLLFSILLLISILAAPILINLAFGKDYLGSIAVFRILALGFLFFTLSTVPSSVIIYHLGKSKISFYITFTKVIIFVSLLVILSKSFGAIGAAWAYTTAEAVFFLISLTITFLIKHEK